MAEFDLEAIKRQMLRKYPAFGSTIANTRYELVGKDHWCPTACAGRDNSITINTDWISQLSPEDQLFSFAHEVCHLALNHCTRAIGKNLAVWNIATDAVINQNLQADGLPIPQGREMIDIPDAINHDAEEMYELLLKNQEQQEQWQNGGFDDHSQWGKPDQQKDQDQQEQQNQQNGQGEQSDQDQDQDGDQNQQGKQNQKGDQGDQNDQNQQGEQGEQGDQTQQDQQGQQGNQSTSGNQQQSGDQDGQDQQQDNQGQQNQPVSESQAFAENRKQREARANQVMQKLKNMRQGFDRKTSFRNLGNDAIPVVSWKKLLRQALEIEDEAWGHKFSDHTNNYRARIQDVEYDEKAETEIILDVSSSISTSLLRNFLRQVKTLLRDSDIKVGTFSNNFHGFQPIKKAADIDNIKLPIGGYTNYDAASRAFTKRKDVNRICFTDGDDGVPIREKRKDIIWISFENPNFKPDFGKVIYIPRNQLKMLTQLPAPETELTR